MTTTMTQEQKIVFILINYMALEGALEHFGAERPSADCFDTLKLTIKEQRPQYWNKYQYEDNARITDDLDAFEYSWRCLTGIRNNLFHANKANKPDPQERLNFLLDWSVDFINVIYEKGGDLAQKSKQIKDILQIKL